MTQYRPLSEIARRSRADVPAPITRQPSISRSQDRSTSHSSRANYIAVPPAILSTTQGAVTSGPGHVPYDSETPTPIASPSPAAAAPIIATSVAAATDTTAPPATATAAATASGPVPLGPRISGRGDDSRPPNTGSNPVENIDIGLLSRIDQALASGVMRPADATKLLQSYGCDLEELLREEMDEQQQGGTGDGVTSTSRAPNRTRSGLSTSCSSGVVASANRILASAPVIRASSAVSFADVTSRPASGSSPFASPLATDPVGSSSPRGGPRGAPTQPLRQLKTPSVPRFGSQPSSCSTQRAQARGESRTASGPNGLGGGGGGVPLDDALLMKLNIALASGAVRPGQATELLMSYGCDLEELLGEEFGSPDGTPGGSSAL